MYLQQAIAEIVNLVKDLLPNYYMPILSTHKVPALSNIMESMRLLQDPKM